MSILQTIGNTAADLMTQMGPVADRMKEGADDLMEKIGSESRHFGEVMGERLSTQLEQVPDATLNRLNLVSAGKSRRRTIFALLLGIILGAVAMKVMESSLERQTSMASRPWNEPQAPEPVTGEVPR